jgi:hypothetical protein
MISPNRKPSFGDAVRNGYAPLTRRVFLLSLTLLIILSSASSFLYAADKGSSSQAPSAEMVQKIAYFSKPKWRYGSQNKDSILICPGYWRSTCRDKYDNSADPVPLTRALAEVEGGPVEILSHENNDRELRVAYNAKPKPDDVVGDSGYPEIRIESSFDPDNPGGWFFTVMWVGVAVAAGFLGFRRMLGLDTFVDQAEDSNPVIPDTPPTLSELSGSNSAEFHTSTQRSQNSAAEDQEPEEDTSRHSGKRRLILD